MSDIPFEDTRTRAVPLIPVLSVASSLIVFALLQALSFNLAGAFDYPLDDPYIHLAIAEMIAQGGYGVNMQELSSPGSSALYPLLLLPFNGTDIHRFVPLFWNIVGLAIAACFWGRLLVEAGYGREGWRFQGMLAAVLGPVALMMPMVAYVGMEHTLHTAAALAVVLGLHRHVQDGRGTALILAGAFFGTALRMEGAALALLAAGALVLSGKRSTGLAAGVAAILPLGLFALWLMSLGLDPLPSSVQAKLATGAEGDLSLLQRRLAVLQGNLREPAGMLIAALSMACLVIWRLLPGPERRRWGPFAAVIFLAIWAHLLAGQIGWLNRYEHYILIIAAAGVMALIPRAMGDGAPNLAAGLAVALVIVGGLVAYRTPLSTVALVKCSRAIHTQQAQLAIFTKEYLKTDVAVNDLGWVAFQNPNYVLDLWGLASAEARERRLGDPTPGWTGELTDKHDVPAAMVYDHWFDDGIGEDWVRIGQLNLTVSGGFLGGYNVAFYATGPEHVDLMRDAVAAWQPTLRPHSNFVWNEGMEP